MLKMTETLSSPKVRKACSLLIILCFILMFFLSAVTADDYGMPTDEPVEIKILLMNVREVFETFLSEENQLSYELYDRGVPAITHSEERDHGQSVYYPFALYLLKYTNMCRANVEYVTVSNAYHLYTAVFCFTAVLALYFVLKELTENKILALLGAVLLYVTPRFFAESHYNNKDIVLLCLFIDMSLFAIRAIKRKKLYDGLAFALLAALAANTKIVGVFFFGVMGFAYIIYVTLNRQWNRHSVLVAIITILAFCGFYYALTPAMWKNPVSYFQYCYDNAFRFSRNAGTVLFDGKVLISRLGQVPRYYLIKYIIITTPLFILLLTLLGFARLVKLGTDKGSYSSKAKWEGMFFVLVICISALLPLIISSISKSIVYNGWRHFYFSYYGVIILACFGLEWLMQRYPKVTVLATTALVAIAGGILIANHPYEFSYFNILAGTQADERYETDYWGLSSADALRVILDDAGDVDTVNVSYLDFESGTRIKWGELMLTQEEQKKINIVDETEDAKYIVENVGFQTMSNRLNIPDDYYLLKSIDAFGNKLVNIYRCD
jgi:hypothetical protein